MKYHRLLDDLIGCTVTIHNSSLTFTAKLQDDPRGFEYGYEIRQGHITLGFADEDIANIDNMTITLKPGMD